MNTLSRLAALTPLLLATACASGGGAGTGSSQPRYDRSRITISEIELGQSRNISTCFDLIQSARPQWLRAGSTGFGGGANTLAVFENNTRLGGVEALRGYPLSNVAELRYLQPSEAGALFGLDVNYGAIQIVTRSGR